MEQRNCPYLGLIDDPTTLKDYPSEDNACHRVKKPVRILLEYQNSHCLCDTYRECPGYIDGWEDGFPVELRAGFDPSKLNLSHKFLLWKESLSKKNGQKEEQQEDRDWKEKLQNILPFSKQASQGEEQIKEESPKKEPEKIELREEPSPERKEKTQPISEKDQLDAVSNKNILNDEAALKEYLHSKKKIPLKTPLHGKKKIENKPDSEKDDQEEQPEKKKTKKKLDLKKAFLSILPWQIKTPAERKAQKDLRDAERLRKKQSSNKRFKQLLEKVQFWKKPRQIDRVEKETFKDRESEKEPPLVKDKPLLREEEISKVEPVEIIQDEQPEPTDELIENQTEVTREELPKEEQPEFLPNEWIKEEALYFSQEKENIRDELARKKKHKNKGALKNKIMSILPWFRKNKAESPPKKTRQTKRAVGRPKEAKKARGNAAQKKASWKKAFSDKRVWLVSLGIILIFLLVIFIPQLPSVNLNIRDRVNNLFNLPISATETTADTPTDDFEGLNQTEANTSQTSESIINAPGEQASPNPTPQPTNTATITSTSIPTPSKTPGPAPFIFITRTETP
mgnify:CR=1 FL=1